MTRSFALALTCLLAVPSAAAKPASARALASTLIALHAVTVADENANEVPRIAQMRLADAKHELRDLAEEILQAQSDGPNAAARARQALLAALREESVHIGDIPPDDASGYYGWLLSVDVTTPPGHPDLV